MQRHVHRFIVRRSHHLPPWLRWSRYTIGSAICFVISEIVFVGLFWPNLLGARGASIVASIAGIIPGYHLNRSWTWGRRGRSDFWREVVPYWVTAIASTAVAAVATGGANHLFSDSSRSERTFFNAGAYMLTYGVLFVVKYIIFQKILFKPPPLPAEAASGDTLASEPLGAS